MARIFLIFWIVIEACNVVLPARADGSTAKRVTLTGVVYANQSGPSGRGTGDVLIKSGTQVYKLRYQKPIRGQLTTPECLRPGAVWRVRAVLESTDSGKLLEALCTGKVDAAVASAISVVGEFLDLSSHANFRAAQMLIVDEKPVSDFLPIGIEFSNYRRLAPHGGESCLEVDPSQTGSTVNVIAGPDCYLRARGKPLDLQFMVKVPEARIVNIAISTAN
jgi:hypothetical protein